MKELGYRDWPSFKKVVQRAIADVRETWRFGLRSLQRVQKPRKWKASGGFQTYELRLQSDCR